MWLWIFIFGVINEKPYMKKLELLICLVMFMIASAKADVIESELQKSRMDNGFIACTSIVKKDCFRFNHNTKSMQTINFNNTKKPLASTDEYVGANDSYFNPNSTTFDKNAIVNFNTTNSNQVLMQSYSAELNPEPTIQNLIKDKINIPVKTTENSQLNVGANKVEFNWSY